MTRLRYFNDLRFIIGIFFGIVGLILMATRLWDPSESATGANLNQVSGAVMFALASLMLALSRFFPTKP